MMRIFRSDVVWPTLVALPVLALLVGLGNWQMSRKTWKEGLLAQIKARISAEPTDITGLALGRYALPPDSEYTRVRVLGQFLHAQERYLYAPDPRLGPGYHVYTPLKREDGGQIYVNRGFVPDALKDPASRQQGQVEGQVEVVGLVRGATSQAYFTPNNDPIRNLWFWRDISAMFGCRDGEPGTLCTSAEEQQARVDKTAPFSIDAAAEPANPGGWPVGGTTILELPNRHLEYAVTWYGLALTLIGVWAAFIVKRLRARPE